METAMNERTFLLSVNHLLISNKNISKKHLRGFQLSLLNIVYALPDIMTCLQVVAHSFVSDKRSALGNLHASRKIYVIMSANRYRQKIEKKESTSVCYFVNNR